MKTILLRAALLVGSVAPALAQVPADAPAGSTGMCVDGTYASEKQKDSACVAHKGVKVWWAAATKEATPPVAREPYDKALAPVVPTSKSEKTNAASGSAPKEAVPPKTATPEPYERALQPDRAPPANPPAK